ncbi:hypothetical protein [Bacillus sp. FJAT-18017]|uniref:hypothetical protein n=1 Tax=Bacillus sp. FJAT-18017 TaxID=1705566 RepID=UPI000ADAD0F5|nr:hypothetical protein [Bacillus sp. FJAT-18017]
MKKLPIILTIAGLAIIAYAFTTEGIYRALIQIAAQILIGIAILLLAPRFRNVLPKGIYYTFLTFITVMLLMMIYLFIDIFITY